ncbi:MAG: glycosyltransferase family 4 protein [Gaiellaceae bacterium]
MRVVVLTTSYPRDDDDPSGHFIADAVERLRDRGVAIDVVSPAVFGSFGLAEAGGIPNNLRRRPWAAPLLVAAMTRATRRAARDTDLVHAHWLPSGAVAAFAGKPFVVTLHGTDVALARQVRLLARAVLRRAQEVIAVSESLAREARELGASSPRVIPNGVEIPTAVEPERSPPEVLYAGRLSKEKGIEDLLAAAAGLRLVVAGDGPLREQVPAALGFVPRDELGRLYDRSAVVVCPSRREGFGLTCAEARAHGRPVVATAVGGLAELVEHEVTGLPVPPRDPLALRAAVDRLLADSDLRARLGAEGRRRVARTCGWEQVIDATLETYERALQSRVRD